MAKPFTAAKIVTGYEPTVYERAAVCPALIMCLANALALKGVLDLADFRDELRRTWDEMPSEDAAGPAGFVFEQAIAQLNTAIPKP